MTASSPEGKTTSLTRDVTVAFKGVNLVVSIDGGRAWLKVWVDGKLDPKIGAAGKVLGDGKTLTFTGKDSIEVRTGSSGVTKFTLNGDVARARSGKSGTPETWLFAPPDEPVDDPAPLATPIVEPPSDEELLALRAARRRCMPVARDAGRHRRVVHGRPRRAPHHRGPGFERATSSVPS